MAIWRTLFPGSQVPDGPGRFIVKTPRPVLGYVRHSFAYTTPEGRLIVQKAAEEFASKHGASVYEEVEAALVG